MSFNLYEAAKGYLNATAASSAATALGENEASVKKGFDAVLPLSMLGITQKAESGQVDSVVNLARESFNSGSLSNIAGMFSGGASHGPSDMLGQIFGNNMEAVNKEVAGYSGLKGSSVAALFGGILPLVLGLIGKHAKENSLTSDGVSSLLASQKSIVLSALPPGMNIVGLLPEGHHHRHHEHHHHTPPPAKKGRMLPRLVPILIVVLLLFWLLRSCMNKKTEQTVAPPVDTTTLASTVQPTTPARESIKVKLPNGVELDAYKGGIEDMLVAFLNGSEPVSKDKWFDFRDLNFKFGTAEIVPESRNEVDNIVKILQAYPKVKVKIGGYTDKVGDEAANKKLSKDRADAVTQVLRRAGVGAQVSDAEGYGSEFAKYPASAPESDRIKDRRVALSVREK